MSGVSSPERLHRVAQYLENQERLLQRLKEIQEKGGSLRFGEANLKASVVAEQYYCEKKVELEHLHGRVETETKSQGSLGHDSLLADSVELNREELLKEIFTEETVIIHEMPMIGEYRGVLLAGQPDAVVFNKGEPVIVLECKFSSSRLPYRTYHAQARVYGKILDSVGFDTSYLFYALAIIPREGFGDKKVFGKILDAVKENGLNEATLKVDGAYVYVYEFNRLEAEKDIDWALEYWKEVREAATADNPNKCRSCEYKVKCSYLVSINE